VYHKVSSSSSRYEKNHSTSYVQRWVPKTDLQLIEAIFEGEKQKGKAVMVCFNVRAAYIANSAKDHGNEELHTPR
jgi:predicted adenine nucleotide alpha hydrolase (AANH) superfamily ATPase